METPERKPIQHFWKLNIKSFAKIWYAQKVVKDRSTKLERLEIETSEFKQINVLAYILQSIRPGDNTFIHISENRQGYGCFQGYRPPHHAETGGEGFRPEGPERGLCR